MNEPTKILMKLVEENANYKTAFAILKAFIKNKQMESESDYVLLSSEELNVILDSVGETDIHVINFSEE